MTELDIVELSVLVLVGLGSGIYAKSEGASSLLAAVIGVVVPVLVYLVTK